LLSTLNEREEDPNVVTLQPCMLPKVWSGRT